MRGGLDSFGLAKPGLRATKTRREPRFPPRARPPGSAPRLGVVAGTHPARQSRAYARRSRGRSGVALPNELCRGGANYAAIFVALNVIWRLSRRIHRRLSAFSAGSAF